MTTQLIKLRGSPTISSHLPAPESCGRTTTKNLHYGNFLLSSPGTTQAASTEHHKHFTILDADAEDRNHKQTHLDEVVRPRKYQTKWFHNITPNPSRYNDVENLPISDSLISSDIKMRSKFLDFRSALQVFKLLSFWHRLRIDHYFCQRIVTVWSKYFIMNRLLVYKIQNSDGLAKMQQSCRMVDGRISSKTRLG